MNNRQQQNSKICEMFFEKEGIFPVIGLIEDFSPKELKKWKSVNKRATSYWSSKVH